VLESIRHLVDLQSPYSGPMFFLPCAGVPCELGSLSDHDARQADLDWLSRNILRRCYIVQKGQHRSSWKRTSVLQVSRVRTRLIAFSALLGLSVQREQTKLNVAAGAPLVTRLLRIDAWRDLLLSPRSPG
jgi:hypothetical protein